MKKKGLNVRQRKFAELVAQGRPAGRAYEEAGYESRGHNADTAGERLSRNVEVKNHIAEVSKKATSNTIMTITERKEMLTRGIKACETKGDWRTAMSLSNELNKMTDGHSAEKVESKVRIVIGGANA